MEKSKKNKKGIFFHRYGGSWYKKTTGFLSSFSGQLRVRDQSGDARDCWNSEFVVRYNSALEETQSAIKRRAALLFDLETNPESILNQFYRETRLKRGWLIPFPSEEVERLINQYNEFIKKMI